MANLKRCIVINFFPLHFFLRVAMDDQVSNKISLNRPDVDITSQYFAPKKLLASIESLLLFLIVCFSSAPLIRFARRSKVHGRGVGREGRTKKRRVRARGREGELGTQQIVLQKSSKYWANSFTFECYACKSRQKIIIVISPGWNLFDRFT